MSTFDGACNRSRSLMGQYCLMDTPDARLRLAAMTNMVSTLAHEVSEPLTAATNYIHTCARLLRNRGDVSEDILAILEVAGRETLKSGDIMRRLRNFIVTGKIAGRRENLRAMIDKVEAVKAFEHGGDVGIHVSVPDDAEHVIAERLHIEQVLSILLKHACETLEGCSDPRVAIGAIRAGEEVVVRILDNGTGLSDQQQARLFEPAFTAAEPQSNPGLSICKALVEAHGGRLWVETPPGGGAAYNFSLPAAD